MAQLFPGSLQEILNQAGFTNEFGETSLRSTVDVGLPKVRQRYTKGIDVFNVSINIGMSDYTTLENFYKITLAGGSLTFEYDHPFTQVATEFRFTKPPSITPLGGLYFQVSMSWEEMP